MTTAPPLHPAHLAATQAATAGDVARAWGLFADAPAVVQRDARFLADHASFATAIGEPALAASLYARAIAATPGDAPPLRLRYALALMDSGQLLAAIDLLDTLTRDHPGSTTAWQAFGAALHAADRVPAAAAAFARVVAVSPDDVRGRLSHARMMTDLGQQSVPAFAAALALAPHHVEARLALAAAHASAGHPDLAVATLRTGLSQSPAWADGWASLASLVYRWEGAPASMAVIAEGLAAAPRDMHVILTMLRSMAAIGAWDAVLAALPTVRARLGDTLPLTLIEADAASEAGDHQRADTAFARLVGIDDAVVQLARVRHALRARRPGEAAAIGEPMMAGAAARFVVPYVGTAWRLLGDPRYDWLEGDPRLVGSYDLGLDRADRTAIGAELRSLHTARHAPFEQSMRGGTQTDGVLLSRQSPAIRTLRAALERAIGVHIAQLPPPDATHPTLSEPRSPFRFAGSWSVRLSGGGHHVNHVHSEGWLSSACYIALPPDMTDASTIDEAGWLTLGQPPANLGLDLPPARTIRPIEGHVVLFPSTMWHGTRLAPDGERLTVAFDVQPLT